MADALVRSLQVAAGMARLLFIVGDRQYDDFLLVPDGADEPIVADLSGVLEIAFPACTELRRHQPLSAPVPGTAQPPSQLRELLRSLTATQVLLVDGELLFEDPAHPRDADYALLRDLEFYARNTSSHGLVCLRVPNLRCVPHALAASPSVRHVNLPSATREERLSFSRGRCLALAESCGIASEEMATLLSNLTDSWRLQEIDKLIELCVAQGIRSRSAIETTVRAVALGVSDSPWASPLLRETVRAAEDKLRERVRGQPLALASVASALRKAVTGLAGAHQGSLSRGPRATLFFAGPTGTGKTEMAKALAELIFGDETALIRFDCAEFRQDHTVARLIGAPPGYVGFESGGELTERVRSRPHSVLLFDEIEKAHPRLLDIFLSILDDGRLTDGQGITTRFDETILVFTSNLGIYEEKEDVTGKTRREPRFDLDNTIAEITTAVQSAIADEFVSRLGRPELLGRLGGERSLIVFDFLRDVAGVTKKFLDKIGERMAALHGLVLDVDPEVIDAVVARASTREWLVLGARGLGTVVEKEISTPLAEYLFKTHRTQGPLHGRWRKDHIEFESEDATPPPSASTALPPARLLLRSVATAESGQ